VTDAQPRPLIVCAGHAARGDDAVGPACAALLARDGIPVHVCSGDALELLELFRSSSAVILVDAIVTGARPPGFLYEDIAGLSTFSDAARRFSSHGLGVAAALQLAQALGVCPPRVRLYGIEARSFEAGADMAPEVAAAVPELAARIAAAWRAASSEPAA
jgi:hydrogenase maturation protease